MSPLPSRLRALVLFAIASLTGWLHAAPTITQQPQATVIVTSGQAAVFSAQATGTGAIRWQWRRMGGALTGQTGPSLTLPAATMAEVGFYDVVATDDTGSTTSAPSRLMITPVGGYQNTFRLDTGFRPVFEKDGANITGIAVAPDGKVYVSGAFVRIAGIARTGLARFSADLTFDPTFTPPALSYCIGLAIQPDGKLIVSANARRDDGTTTGPLVRLLSDGTIDPSFVAPVFGPYNSPSSVAVAAIQPDGKILVTGSFKIVGTLARSALVRLNANGSVDSNYVPQLGRSPTLVHLALSGAKIVVFGAFSGPTGTSRSLIRLNSDGSEDTTFSPQFDNSVQGYGPLAVDSAGRIYINGKRTPGGFDETLRLLPDGSIDSTFATYPQTAFETVMVLPDNRTVGTWWNWSQPMVGVFAADGSRESSRSFTDSASALPSRFAIAPDGSIYSGGNSCTYGPLVGGVARLSAGSQVLNSITAGLVSTTMPSAVHPAPGGKWLVGGDFNYVNGAARQGLARLNADGTTDTTFLPDNPGFQVSKIAVQGDGAILAMGTKTPYARRFLTDGLRDPSFPFHARNSLGSIDRVLALPDGGMAFMGWLSSRYGDQALNTSVLLLQPNGASDPTSPSLLRVGFNLSNMMVEAVGGGFVAAGNLPTASDMLPLLWQDRLGGTVFPQSSPSGLPPLAGACFDSKGVLVTISRSTSEIFRLNSQGTILSTKSVPTLAPQVPGTTYPQTDSNILLVAKATPGSSGFGPLLRLNPDDTIDTTFRIADLTGTSGIFPYADIHYTDDGRLLVCGAYAVRDGIEQNGLALFKPEALPPAPVITRQPVPVDAPAGGDATFEIEASGIITSFRWYKDSTLVATTSVPRLSLGNLAADAYGSYTAEAEGPGGIARSQPVMLVSSTVQPATRPMITTQPASQSGVSGTSAALTVAATGASPVTYQWYRGGRPVAGATSAALAFPSVAPNNAGIYDVSVTDSGSTLSKPAVVGVLPPAGSQTAGAVTTRAEWQGIVHPKGNVYDQFLLAGSAGTFTAATGRVARMSFLDENESIVQVEMSGAGAITVVLDNASGPMAPALYNQNGIQYMKGKATIILAGADATTHFTIYSVGTATNPGVTRSDVEYAGWADVAAAGIVSKDGGLGGIHQGNVDYNASLGFTGLYAPTVTSVAGLVVIHTIAASVDATPYLYFGPTAQVQVKIAGSSLAQPNADNLTVSGLAQVTMGAGQDSCGRSAPAAAIQTRLLKDDDTDVTTAVVTGP